MSEFPFEALPDQVRHLLDVQSEVASEALFGFAEGWTMPLGLWHARDGFDTSYQAHDHCSLSFVRSGGPVERMDGRCAGRKGGTHPDCFMLYPGGEPRRYTGRGPIGLCHIYFRSAFLANLHEQETDGSSAGLEICDDRVLVLDPSLRRLSEEYMRRAQDRTLLPTRLEMDARSVLIGLHVLRYHSNRRQQAPSAVRAGLSSRQLRTVLDYMDAHLASDVTLARLAKVAGLSERHFCTAFRTAVGLPPHRYVMQMRVSRAKRLLEGDQPLAQIAFACGFGSQQHLTTSFRSLAGTTPAVWRRTNR